MSQNGDAEKGLPGPSEANDDNSINSTEDSGTTYSTVISSKDNNRASMMSKQGTGSAAGSWLQNTIDSTPLSYNIFRDIIIPERVANVTMATFLSVILAASAVVADMLGNITYSLYKEKSVSESLADFALIPMMGSAFLMVAACLALAYSGFLAELVYDNNRARGLSWFIVAMNFLLNTLLGFAVDKWIMLDNRAQLQEECLWSKLFGFVIVMCVSAGVVVSGAERYIGLKLLDMYDAIQNAFEKIIGPGTPAHEHGVSGLLSDCCFGLFPKGQSDVSSLGHISDNEGDIEKGVAAEDGMNTPLMDSYKG